VDNQVPQTGERIGEYKITSGWGPRKQPTPGTSTYHRGIDVGTPFGSPVFAVTKQSTISVECFPDDGLGKPWSRQTSPDFPGLAFEVLHLSECYPGTYPPKAVFAKSGIAGTGPHMHIQVRRMDLLNNDPEMCGSNTCNGLIPPPRYFVKAIATGSF
jgi:hypothetical protein